MIGAEETRLSTLGWMSELDAAARQLAERLRRREVPRVTRSAARRCLVAAFEASCAGDAPLSLLRAVDELAMPLRAAIPVRRRPIGPGRPLGVIDEALVARVFAFEGAATRIEARVERFLSVTGGAALIVPLRERVEAETDAIVDLELTRG